MSSPPAASPLVEPPADAGTIQRSFFGMHDHDPVGASWPDAPVGSLRVWDSGATWRDIEISPGVFNFDRLDQIVQTARRHRADVLIVLGQTPAFHATDPAAPSYYGPGAASMPDLGAWKTYVRKVAHRYAGKDVSLQVWNEANVTGFWTGTPAQMAELTRATRDALEGVSPRPTLVGPAFVTRRASQQAWLDQFYAQRVAGTPVADLVDAVSLQLYTAPGGTPEDSMAILAADRRILAKNGVAADKPIWNTEVNSGLSGTPIPPAPVERQQAQVARTYLLNAANGVDRVFWYAWDQQTLVDTFLTGPDGATLSPAGRSFHQVQRWLTGFGSPVCDADVVGTYTCVLRRDDGSVRDVIWNPTIDVMVHVPGRAATYESADGRSVPLPADRSVTVGSTPMMIEVAD